MASNEGDGPPPDDEVHQLSETFSMMNREKKELHKFQEELNAREEALKAREEELNAREEELRGLLVERREDEEDSPQKQYSALTVIIGKIKKGSRISQNQYDTILKVTGDGALIPGRRGSRTAEGRQEAIQQTLATAWEAVTGDVPEFENFDKVLECLRRLVKPEPGKSDKKSEEMFAQIVKEMDREMMGAAGAAGAKVEEAE